MRRRITVAALSAACLAGQQSLPAQQPADAVARHRAVYRAVERGLSRYRHAAASMDDLGLERQSAEGGHLEAYCEGAAVRLLVADYYGETGDATDRYYFEHDSLFFVLAEVRRGRPDARTPYPPRTIVERERFYFTGNHLIRWFSTNNRPQNVRSPEAQERAGELLGDARRLRDAMPACEPKYGRLASPKARIAVRSANEPLLPTSGGR